MSLTLLLATLLVSQAKADGPKWIDATSKDETFSFAMPAEPIENSVTQQSAQGPINVLRYSCISDGCLYLIEKTKLSVEIPDERREGALRASRDSVAKKTKLIGDQAKIVAGWPARELRAQAPLKPGAKPSDFAILILCTDQELYQIRVLPLRPENSLKDVRKFFDSFKPKKNGPNAKKE